MSTYNAAYQAAYAADHKEERRAYMADYMADYRAANPEFVATARDRKYNLHPGEWDAMFAAQGNACAICGSGEPGGNGWHTDHDHDTGKVRGILCHRHNLGLGHFNDDPELLMAAIEYLAVAT